MEWVVLIVGGAFASTPLAAALLLRARVLFVALATAVALAGLAAVSFYVWLYLELGGDSSGGIQLASAVMAALQVAAAVSFAARRRAPRPQALSTNAP